MYSVINGHFCAFNLAMSDKHHVRADRVKFIITIVSYFRTLLRTNLYEASYWITQSGVACKKRHRVWTIYEFLSVVHTWNRLPSTRHLLLDLKILSQGPRGPYRVYSSPIRSTASQWIILTIFSPTLNNRISVRHICRNSSFSNVDSRYIVITLLLLLNKNITAIYCITQTYYVYKFRSINLFIVLA